MFRKLAVCVALLIFVLPVIAQKMTAADVVAKHLDAIGAAEKRAAIRNVMASGEVTIKFIVPKDISVGGRAVLASAGAKNFFGMGVAGRASETFICDGKKVKVSFLQRSVLGEFIKSNELLLEDSLL